MEGPRPHLISISFAETARVLLNVLAFTLNGGNPAPLGGTSSGIRHARPRAMRASLLSIPLLLLLFLHCGGSSGDDFTNGSGSTATNDAAAPPNADASGDTTTND